MKEKYCCFLRGINVSGRNLIRMKDLEQLFTAKEFPGARTYLQSGNVIFSHEATDPYKLSVKISGMIRDAFNLEVPALVIAGNELEALYSSNPFCEDLTLDSDKLHVTILGSDPENQKVASLSGTDYSPERYIVKGKAIYLYCPDGYGRAKLNNNYLERKLGVQATTRNWRTIEAVLGLLREV